MIHAKGSFRQPIFENKTKWDINYSSILSQLIQWAGRFTESYASDLYIIWKYNVDRKLDDENLESYSLLFGFREMGVDDQILGDPEYTVVESHIKENRYYYRKVARLDVTINGNDIEMELKEVN